ncbi:MAG: alpha/beta hydrolase [Pseudomonadales bacterium]
MTWIVSLIVLALALWLVARFALAGEDLSRFDQPRVTAHNAGQPPSPQQQDVLDDLSRLFGASSGKRGKARLLSARAAMDQFGEGVETSGLSFAPVTVNGVNAEWVLAENSNPQRRLLYLHGGAFTLGSPRSHRRITAQFAQQMGLSVLSVDYRLMPEHRRLDGLEDSMNAYRWLLANGPQGASEADAMLVAGDSAGGNLTLAVLAQARDLGLRSADAAIALSPATDGTFASPSISRNRETDAMLGPTLRPMLKVPKALLLWGALLAGRALPTDPRISPLRGDLRNLPPTLILASECEMLLDDAVRYANKAQAAGSSVRLVTWEHMVHVWQFFVPKLPEAQASFDVIAAFVEEHAAEKAGAGDVAA